MKVNESGVDRLIRAIAGLVLLGLSLFGMVQGTLAVVLIVLGAILLITSAVGFCPLYTLFHFSTKKS